MLDAVKCTYSYIYICGKLCITMGQTDLWPDAQNSATQSPKAQTATPSLAANVTSPSPLPTVRMTEGVSE